MERQRVRRRTQRVPQTRLYIIIGICVVALIAAGFLIFKPKSNDAANDNTGGEGYSALSERAVKKVLKQDENQASGTAGEVIEHAVSLLGEVHYFWGGKSLVMGKDENWGEPRTVTSEGSSNTGKEIPYGLDCSGYIAWCFRQTGMSEDEVRNQLGLGTYHQWQNSTEINWDDLKPGDFVFQNEPPTDENHVGICIGRDEEGEPLFIHCAAKFDNVVVTYKGDIFKYARRPNLY